MAALTTEPVLAEMFRTGAKLPVSFEVFPPKSENARASLHYTATRLADADPGFFSVTSSPDGSSRERTLAVARELAACTETPVKIHFTASGHTREQIDAHADRMWADGIRHVLALRGDRPADADRRGIPQAYEHADGLVAALKARHDFDVSVAAYPEKHPEAPSLDADIEHLKAKFDAGADRAICQFVFDAESYGRFRERAERHGIDKPLVPGVIVPTNWRRIRRFAVKAGASVPDWLDELFDGVEDEPEIAQLTAMATVQQQVRRLIAYGAPAIHFYTMNTWQIPLAAGHLMGRHVGDFLGKTWCGAA
ncbi:5,10-methylenetetrahydrofolate reductase (NAD(P)) [Limimonas halophila]|uniref:Methylenetetrahydrofolate reductase n=1 Tax=Limimonas halophila TaxID=1082479 RepID=A0A1G7T7L6_9PROT|nr:methylenetetrahydrofolate reductase [Limimonas halophila]SDG31258.1 5,10-methylenetetrahydrofolate reductase (NAD(P)) [Limimonas halophila]